MVQSVVNPVKSHLTHLMDRAVISLSSHCSQSPTRTNMIGGRCLSHLSSIDKEVPKCSVLLSELIGFIHLVLMWIARQHFIIGCMAQNAHLPESVPSSSKFRIDG